MAVVTLLHNTAVLFAMAAMFDAATSRLQVAGRVLRQVVIGATIGGLCFGLILTAYRGESGIAVDTRSVLLALSGLFFGPLTTIVAASMTAAFLLVEGGLAAVGGAAIALASGGLGVVWRHGRRGSLGDISWQELYLFGLAAHVLVLSLMVMLPWSVASRMLASIGPLVLLLHPLAVVAVGLLLAGRVRSERNAAALAESEARHRLVLEHSTDAILLTDPDGTSVTANPAACAMFGRTEDEIRQAGRGGLADPDDPRLAAMLDERARTGRAVGELTLWRRDGTPFPADVSTTVFVDQHGERRSSMIIRDVTERRRAEDETRRLLAALSQLNAELDRRVLERTAELTEANEELESFAYAVSHDLRAPLRAMNGFSAALVQDYGDRLPAGAPAYLNEIVLATQNMGRLIDGLLALSRCARGELHREPVDLSAIADRVCHELTTADPGRSIDWQVDRGLTMWGDSRMLEAVLRNLLGNAFKYTGKTPAPWVRVYAEHQDGSPFCCIADNGAGFEMRHADRLFKPFQRLHRQDEFPGIGIGLATVKRVIHRHGGTLSATAEVGAGAVFRFSLPPGIAPDANRGTTNSIPRG